MLQVWISERIPMRIMTEYSPKYSAKYPVEIFQSREQTLLHRIHGIFCLLQIGLGEVYAGFYQDDPVPHSQTPCEMIQSLHHRGDEIVGVPDNYVIEEDFM